MSLGVLHGTSSFFIFHIQFISDSFNPPPQTYLTCFHCVSISIFSTQIQTLQTNWSLSVSPSPLLIHTPDHNYSDYIVSGPESSSGPKLPLEFSLNLHRGLWGSVWLKPCLFSWFISHHPSSCPTTWMLFYFLQCDKLFSTSGSSHLLLFLLWEWLSISGFSGPRSSLTLLDKISLLSFSFKAHCSFLSLYNFLICLYAVTYWNQCPNTSLKAPRV